MPRVCLRVYCLTVELVFSPYQLTVYLILLSLDPTPRTIQQVSVAAYCLLIKKGLLSYLEDETLYAVPSNNQRMALILRDTARLNVPVSCLAHSFLYHVAFTGASGTFPHLNHSHDATAECWDQTRNTAYSF